MKVYRSVAGYFLCDHTTNEEKRKLMVKNLNEIIVDYRCKRTQHLKN
jgi:hypothetical protein